jgi:cell division protein FtsQ
MVVSILVACALASTLIESPLFVVTGVEVHASGRVSPDEIRRVSRIRPGMNLVTLDTDEVSRRLEAHRWIQNATVVKRFPDRVLIKVRMREPAAVIGIRGDLHYMDGEGTVLGRIRAGEALDFPVVTGLDRDVQEARRCRGGRDVQQALGLLRVLQATPSLGRVSEIHLDPSEGLSFVLEGFPLPVYVGWSGFSGKVIRFEKILPGVIARAAFIERVDLRFSDQIVVREGRGQKPRLPGEDRAEARVDSASSFHPT